MKHRMLKYKEYLINWLRDWFETNGKECLGVFGCSGGKDSACIGALLCEAIGKDRVIGVLMPNGEQHDIADSYKVCRHLGIRHVEINIAGAYYNILKQFPREGIKETSEQTKINLGPRIRMSILYAVAQSMNGRVIGTSNLDETLLGWETRWGDAVSDCEPIIKLHANEVCELCELLGIPYDIAYKLPTDGLGEIIKSDEEKFGFTYAELQDFYERHMGQMDLRFPGEVLTEKEEKMYQMWKKSEFKRRPIPEPSYFPCMFDEEKEECPQENKGDDLCDICTNVKGCITCTDHDQYMGGEME